MIRASASVRTAAVRRNLPAVRRVAAPLPGHDLLFTC